MEEDQSSSIRTRISSSDDFLVTIDDDYVVGSIGCRYGLTLSLNLFALSMKNRRMVFKSDSNGLSGFHTSWSSRHSVYFLF